MYHFTDRANIPSIKKHGGPYSWYTCEQKSIEIKMPGGNQLSRDLDLRYNLHDYVRLSFNKKALLINLWVNMSILLKNKIKIIIFNNWASTAGEQLA